LGVAAVHLVAREARPIAQVLPARAAVAALAAAPAEPGHPHAVSDAEAVDAGPSPGRGDGPHDLVTEDERQRGVWQLAVENMQVGAAHTDRKSTRLNSSHG